jgi:hypothetical protein
VTEQTAVQMADLGLETRNEVYAPDTDASSRNLLSKQLMFYRKPHSVVRWLSIFKESITYLIVFSYLRYDLRRPTKQNIYEEKQH